MENMALNRIPEWQFLQFGGIRITIQLYNFFFNEFITSWKTRIGNIEVVNIKINEMGKSWC